MSSLQDKVTLTITDVPKQGEEYDVVPPWTDRRTFVAAIA